MKVCYKCKIEKELNDFSKDKTRKDGFSNRCKKCQRIYILENKDTLKKYYKNYYSIEENLLKRRAQQRARKLQRLKYQKDKIKNDINFKIARRLRGRLHKVLNGRYKSGSAVNDLGCTLNYLKKYFDDMFSDGMTWSNYGEWHIDHIRPLCSFDLTDREQFLEACNYKNLQPLWAKDNLYKGGSYYAA